VPRRMLLLSLAVLVSLVVPVAAWAAPTARYTYSPSTPVTGTVTTFDASASRCDRSPCTYRWTDDGPDGPGGQNWTLGSGKVLGFTFSSAGKKYIRLTVTNNRGRRSQTAKTITVTAPPSAPAPTLEPAPTPAPTPEPTPAPTPAPAPEPTPVPPAGDCTAGAGPANLSSVFAAATPGSVICLVAGSYGSFSGGAKAAPGVTLRPAAGVSRAEVTIGLNFRPASGITVDGVSLTGAQFEYAGTRNITVRNSDLIGNGRVVFRTEQMANSNVLFEGNRLAGQNVCSGCFDARIHLPNRNESQPSGVTIRGNLFTGGNADGIQNGSNGTVIEGNQFVDIRQGDGGAHTDAIQLYGSKNTIIRRNFFHDVSMCIMAPDEADHELIEDNVCVQRVGNGLVGGLQLGSDDGSIIRHNTWYDSGARDCDYDTRCGIMSFGHKPVDDVSRNTQIYDNLVAEISSLEGNQAAHHNLFTFSRRSGTGDIFGMPTYVGGQRPSTYAGYRLAPGSIGKGTASDGLDIGARIP